MLNQRRDGADDRDRGGHPQAHARAGRGRRGDRPAARPAQINAEEPGHLAAVRWARGLDDERLWAIEDCRHVSRRLEQALVAAGERVVRVAPHRMGASRRGEREPGKSDQIDALAIARAVVKDGPERFPVAYLDEEAMEVRLLSDHRKDLVAERTRAQNRLRWHLLELCPGLERSLGRGALEQPRQLERIDRCLRRLPACARVRVARAQLAHIRLLTRQANALERELLTLIEAQRPQLLAETGCGAVDRGDHDRPHRRRRAVSIRRQLRPPDRYRADSLLRRTARPPPPRPRRRPPAQPRAAHHRHHPRPL
jgi:transposase